MHRYFVYIITNVNRTVLYTGVTNDLKSRIIQHFEKKAPNSFTAKYNVYFLLYYEEHKYIDKATAREKEIKGWRREKKMQLIVTTNPMLEFLNKELFGEWPLR